LKKKKNMGTQIGRRGKKRGCRDWEIHRTSIKSGGPCVEYEYSWDEKKGTRGEGPKCNAVYNS